MKHRAIRGMNDILPDEIGRWHRLESTFRTWAERQGYAEIRTPVLESTSLFAKQMGEATDVVEKEMYSFERHGDELTVRPEGTAGVARAYVEHKLANKEPVSRVYYLGPMFRGERPAKGRYRQFYQAGCELFGDPGPVGDADMIAALTELFRELAIPDIAVHINSLGGAGTRERYREALTTYFEPLKDKLSEDSQRRLAKNPLRILDSKDEGDQSLAEGAPKLADLLDDDDREHFDGLQACLTAANVPFTVDPLLVRGLDYYTRTLFEIRTSAGDLGAQNTLCGGGRYDHMVKSLGGADVPAIGFAMGLERILVAMPDRAQDPTPCCLLGVLSPGGGGPAVRIAQQLRQRDLRVELDGRPVRLKAMFKRADAIGARWLAMFGDDELSRGVIAVKDLVKKTQTDVPLDTAVEEISALMRGAANDATAVDRSPEGTSEGSH